MTSAGQEPKTRYLAQARLMTGLGNQGIPEYVCLRRRCGSPARTALALLIFCPLGSDYRTKGSPSQSRTPRNLEQTFRHRGAPAVGARWFVRGTLGPRRPRGLKSAALFLGWNRKQGGAIWASPRSPNAALCGGWIDSPCTRVPHPWKGRPLPAEPGALVPERGHPRRPPAEPGAGGENWWACPLIARSGQSRRDV